MREEREEGEEIEKRNSYDICVFLLYYIRKKINLFFILKYNFFK